MPGTPGPRLGLVWGYAPGEAGWGVGGFNPNFQKLEALVHLTVVSITTTPPATPANGDCYIVGVGGTGVWAGHNSDVAVWYTTGGWLYIDPAIGVRAYNRATSTYWRYDGSAWIQETVPSANVSGPASAIDANIVIFDGATGKIIRDGGQSLPDGFLVGTTDDQILTNKIIEGASNSLTVRLEADVTGNLPITRLGGGTGASATTAWYGDGTWKEPAGGINQLTGDVTAGPGSGSVATTLAATAVTPGAYTNSNITVDGKGRITAAASGTGGGITQLTGDVTAGPGSGSVATTLANTAVAAGSYTNTNLTVDAKGRVIAASNGTTGGGASITVSDTPPASPTQGQLWFDGETACLFVWFVDAGGGTGQWVVAVNSGGGGTSGSTDWTDITGKPSTFPPALPIAQSGVTNLVTDLAAKASLDSPAFTGTPSLPTGATAITQTTGTNNTTVATTGFVKAQGYQSVNQTITLNGAITGSGATTITTTLATVAPTLGGTGLTTYAQGDLIYANATNTLAKLAKDATATRYLSNGGATNNPAWAAVNLTNGVTGTLPVASGGTAATTLPLVNPLGLSSYFGITTTLLSSNGSAVAPVSATDGTVGMASGSTITVVGSGTNSGLDLARCNGTLAAPTAVLVDQSIGGLYFDAYATSTWSGAGMFRCIAAQNWSNTAQGTRFEWVLAANNTATLTNVMALDGSGNLTIQGGTATKAGGGSWVAPSDISLKRDIATYTSGLEQVLALRPITYEYNGKGGLPDDGRRFVGLDAGDTEAAMPELVGTMMLDTEIKTIDNSPLIYALVNACKELAVRIAALEETQ